MFLCKTRSRLMKGKPGKMVAVCCELDICIKRIDILFTFTIILFLVYSGTV